LSFERKQKLREDIKKTRELSRALINERNAENEARKERRRENIKRRAENQRKSEVVQVVIYLFYLLIKKYLDFFILPIFILCKAIISKFGLFLLDSIFFYY